MKDFKDEDYEIRKKATWGSSNISRASLDGILDDAPAYIKEDYTHFLYKDELASTVLSDYQNSDWDKLRITGYINFGWMREDNPEGCWGLYSAAYNKYPVIFADDNSATDTKSCLFIWGGEGGAHGDVTPHRGLRIYAGIVDDEPGTKAIQIEKFGAGGYGLAIDHHGDNAGNPALTVGLGIDYWYRGCAIRIRKASGGVAGGYGIYIDSFEENTPIFAAVRGSYYPFVVERVNVAQWRLYIDPDGNLKWVNGDGATRHTITYS